jgi:hypothetical protein
MKSKSPAPSIVMSIAVVGSVCAAFIVCGSVARAYEVPSAGQLPVPSALMATGSPQGYNFGNSFGNLISPFENFFNSMNGGNVSVPVNLNLGGSNISSTITIGINVQQYINQYIQEFDAWFYEHTGVHIAWLINIFIGIIYWIWWLADSAVRWIIGLFH